MTNLCYIYRLDILPIKSTTQECDRIDETYQVLLAQLQQWQFQLNKFHGKLSLLPLTVMSNKL